MTLLATSGRMVVFCASCCCVETEVCSARYVKVERFWFQQPRLQSKCQVYHHCFLCAEWVEEPCKADKKECGLCCVSSQVRLECIHSVASAWLGRFQDFIMHNRGGVERWGNKRRGKNRGIQFYCLPFSSFFGLFVCLLFFCCFFFEYFSLLLFFFFWYSCLFDMVWEN